ncbi:hypothetical protein H1C71_028804 [Ictidomys tridecemlineatus]|nr:hypothetical protein H1C71_028804 [Ictidomys tridecemlineatus]
MRSQPPGPGGGREERYPVAFLSHRPGSGAGAAVPLEMPSGDPRLRTRLRPSGGRGPATKPTGGGALMLLAGKGNGKATVEKSNGPPTVTARSTRPADPLLGVCPRNRVYDRAKADLFPDLYSNIIANS